MKKYRKNVAIVVFNKDRKILVCERIGRHRTPAWQFPQGGINENENVEAAAYRELFEETSIVSAKLIKILDEPIIYEYPNDVRKSLKKHNNNIEYFGQEQQWVLLYFYGEDNEINLSTKEPEFKSYKWESAEFAVNNVVDFKKASYIKALNLIKPHILNYDVSLKF
ncbi:MAG: RNA pyrophosphohydrolase [Lactobacillaceae bacterium]|jgi:putative (di)nucleoside polyphosphate hydrolase|nr:RNA pyrophosphohydrolase [Lactobacillaceae bacterium]